MAGVKTSNGLKTILRSIAKDVRTHPNKRLLAALIIAHQDGEEWALDIMQTQYGSSGRVRWKDPEEENIPDNVIEREANEVIKKMFAVSEENHANTSTTSESSGS